MVFLRTWLQMYREKVVETAHFALTQDGLVMSEYTSLQDSSLGLLRRLAILYRLAVLVAVTASVVAVYAFVAVQKEIVTTALTALIQSMQRTLMEPGLMGRRTPVQVRFADSVAVSSTYSSAEYDRTEIERQQLGPELFREAHSFLIDYKHNEMKVHPDSRHNTHIFKLR